MNKQILKDLYKDSFLIGVSCEPINEKNPNNEIGNPEKENLILEHFNIMTFANALKPIFNCGYNSPEAKEDYLPFKIGAEALTQIEFCKKHNILIHGHVFVWHSQCPPQIFCKNYELKTVPVDDSVLKEKPWMRYFAPIEPDAFVSRDIMLKRMQSYIYSQLEYMYANDYIKLFYVWDVVNEAIEPDDKCDYLLRNSYWYKIIGKDFVYWAFKFARDAENELAVKYASRYGINPDDDKALQAIKPKLVYNDYNEWQPIKKEAIIRLLNYKEDNHGSIISEGLIDGIGMQGHLSDNNDISLYIAALKEYSNYVDEVHVSELDVKCTSTNINAGYYQAAFYNDLFKGFIKANKEGAKLKSVTFWGLTDDNSWIRGNDPLLFNKDLSCKKAFDGVCYAITGGNLGEPEIIKLNLNDRYYDFADTKDGKPFDPTENGIRMKGIGKFDIITDPEDCNNKIIEVPFRGGSWSGVMFDLSDFIGMTVDIECNVSSTADVIALKYEHGDQSEIIASTQCSPKEWSSLRVRYHIPRDIRSFGVFVSTPEDSHSGDRIYINNFKTKLIGIEENFDKEEHIVSVRGAGHLPFLRIIDNDFVKGEKCLCVTRQEKDATISIDTSYFVGHKIHFKAFIRTNDTTIYTGIDAVELNQEKVFSAKSNERTLVEADFDLSALENSAKIYIATNSTAEFFVDNIIITLKG